MKKFNKISFRHSRALPSVLLISVLLLGVTSPLGAQAVTPDYTRVRIDLETYDKTIAQMNVDFDRLAANPRDKEWVKKKLVHMVAIDQYVRNYFAIPNEHHYSEEESKEFLASLKPRAQKVDSTNTAELKLLLKLYPWFTISEFGVKADNAAFVLVQHADRNEAFQKEILAKLETLYPAGETNKQNYAYLFDRIAVHQKTLQRYGTQGHCVRPSVWEAFPIESEADVDKRRNEMGLEPMDIYRSRFKDICH